MTRITRRGRAVAAATVALVAGLVAAPLPVARAATRRAS
jgi:hypothetical protein